MGPRPHLAASQYGWALVTVATLPCREVGRRPGRSDPQPIAESICCPVAGRRPQDSSSLTMTASIDAVTTKSTTMTGASILQAPMIAVRLMSATITSTPAVKMISKPIPRSWIGWPRPSTGVGRGAGTDGVPECWPLWSCSRPDSGGGRCTGGRVAADRPGGRLAGGRTGLTVDTAGLLFTISLCKLPGAIGPAVEMRCHRGACRQQDHDRHERSIAEAPGDRPKSFGIGGASPHRHDRDRE